MACPNSTDPTATETATATATATTDASPTATATTEDNSVAVTSVALSPTTKSLVVGGTLQLGLTILPENATDKSVTYATSNSAIATVDAAGLVTAVAAGSATITVTTTSAALQATCAVTVSAAAVATTAVTLSSSAETVLTGNTVSLTATYTPADNTDTPVWSSSDQTVATVSGGVVTGVKAGTATITITSGSATATATITVVNAGSSASYPALVYSTQAVDYKTIPSADGNCLIYFKGVTGAIASGDRIRYDFTLAGTNLTNYKNIAVQDNAYGNFTWCVGSTWSGSGTTSPSSFGYTGVANQAVDAGAHLFSIYIGNQVAASTTEETFTITNLTVKNYGPAAAGLVYEALGTAASTINLPVNGTDNYQQLVLLSNDLTVASGDSYSVTIAGTSNVAGTLKCFLVDNSEAAGWWKVISGYSDIGAFSSTENSYTFTVTATSAGSATTAIKLGLYMDLSVGSSPTLSLTTFKVVKN
jgi:hypothetical protein